MTSVGLEGSILHRREALQDNGIRGPQAYAMAALGYFFGNVERTRLTITADGETLEVPDAVTVIVTKIAYYGYGMKIVPDAQFDDGYLHLLAVNSPLPEIVQNLATSFFAENRLGIYRKARQITVTTDAERYLQTDGSIYGKGTTFRFDVIERGLKMWY
jgi:diacylglycerol kinase family enzyme